MEQAGSDVLVDVSKNPLLCAICHDYFMEPCILNCYHTFCGRCLRGRDQDSRYACPLCGHQTQLKDGSALPPPDTLMRQLIDIANSENPPCANCDKRDRSSMFYCSTCGQALCTHCRDNTHRAKMFSSHEVVHMSKCGREPRRCQQHGEHYIMYSPIQHSMLCVNCFRDTPADVRAQCIDMDTAHTQALKRLERGQNAIMDLQSSVRDGLISLKSMLDDLRRNMETEKHTINTFCQGMQEAMAKTHAAMIMEVQRQFESKERSYRAQLVALGTVMPVLQLHLVLCTTFTAAANKYQFLELCPSIIERLAAVGQLSQPIRNLQSSVIRTNFRSEFAQCLEPWVGKTSTGQQRVYETKRQQQLQPQLLKNKPQTSGEDGPFVLHCRSFDTQLKESSLQLVAVKERIGELHRDVTAWRKAQTPPLLVRYENIAKDCAHLDENLERQQAELERLANVFDTNWEEQLWNLRVEQEMFSCQRADIMTLRNELKHLSTMTSQLEPYIRSIMPLEKVDDQQLNSLLDHFGRMQGGAAEVVNKLPRSRSRVLGQLLEKVRPTVDNRERSKSAGQTEQQQKIGMCTPLKVKKPNAANQQHQQTIERLESQLKEKIHDLMYRRQSKQQETAETKLSKTDLDRLAKISNKMRHGHKKMGKSCDKLSSGTTKLDLEKKKCSSDPDYQRISDTTSSQSVKALVHKEVRSSPSSPKHKNKRPPKIYPYSDGEDNVFYSRNDSVESLSTNTSVNSRRSSIECPDKTLVVVIGTRNKQMTLAQKQRSWETFPPKRKHHVCHKLSVPAPMPPLKKADSFEGHEEAVKTLVAAVQETRRKPKTPTN